MDITKNCLLASCQEVIENLLILQSFPKKYQKYWYLAGTSNQINQKMDSKINIEQIDDYGEVMNSFNKTIEDMKKKIDTDKTYFLLAIKSFPTKKMLKHMLVLPQEWRRLVSTRHPGLSHISKKPKLVSDKEIGTQPIARSRRVTQIGGRKH